METLFFILGIASVVVIATAIVAVVSIVKVTKLQTRLNDEGSGLQQSIDAIYRALDDNIRNNDRNLDIVQDHFAAQLDSRLDKLISKTDKSIEELHRIFSDYINNNKIKK